MSEQQKEVYAADIFRDLRDEIDRRELNGEQSATMTIHDIRYLVDIGVAATEKAIKLELELVQARTTCGSCGEKRKELDGLCGACYFAKWYDDRGGYIPKE